MLPNSLDLPYFVDSFQAIKHFVMRTRVLNCLKRFTIAFSVEFRFANAFQYLKTLSK